MKVDDATLQAILKNYGKQIRPDKSRPKPQKEEPIEKDKAEQKLDSQELNIVNYDKEGKVKLNPQKKEALVDFFE